MVRAKRVKEKVTIYIDPEILKLVDNFVENSTEVRISRSSVFEQALQLWRQQTRDPFDEHYYSQHADALNDASWTEITTEAARKIWRE